MIPHTRAAYIAALAVTLILVVASVALAATAETNVSSSPSQAIAPALVVTSNNTVQIAWEEDDGLVYHTTFTDGSPPQSFGYGDSVTAVADGNDVTHLAWVDLIGSNFEIIYRQLTATGTWSVPYNVSLTSGVSVEPAITTDVLNNLHIVWTDTSPGFRAIYYYYREASTGFEAAGPIPYAAGVAPDIAVDDSGTRHVVWQDDGQPFVIFYAKSADGGSWSLPEKLSTNTTLDAQAPQIAVVDGVVYVVWVEGGRVWATEGTSGSWTAPAPISGTDTDAQSPDLQLDGLDHLHATWADSDQALRYTHRQPAGAWEPPITLDLNATGLAYPALATDDAGTAHVAWAKADATWDIYYQTRAVPTLIGDLDSSCTIDVRDVVEVAAHLNNTVTDPTFNFNGDDQIDGDDVREVASRWHHTCP